MMLLLLLLLLQTNCPRGDRANKISGLELSDFHSKHDSDCRRMIIKDLHGSCPDQRVGSRKV